MERWTRPALAAAGTLCLILGFRYEGLILEPEVDGSPPDVNGFAWWLSLLGVCLLVRAAGGHRTGLGCLVSIAGIVLLSSPFWGETITFFLFVLPLTGAAVGAVIISAAIARRAEKAEGSSPPTTSAPVRRALTIVGVVLVLASIACFIYIADLLSSIPME